MSTQTIVPTPRTRKGDGARTRRQFLGAVAGLAASCALPASAEQPNTGATVTLAGKAAAVALKRELAITDETPRGVRYVRLKAHFGDVRIDEQAQVPPHIFVSGETRVVVCKPGTPIFDRVRSLAIAALAMAPTPRGEVSAADLLRQKWEVRQAFGQAFAREWLRDAPSIVNPTEDAVFLNALNDPRTEVRISTTCGSYIYERRDGRQTVTIAAAEVAEWEAKLGRALA